DIGIPNSVTDIGDSAFSWCANLTDITLPEGITTIGWSVFSDCRSLSSITLPEGVSGIGEFAFYDCASLRSITIPESVTSIGRGAFSLRAARSSKQRGKETAVIIKMGSEGCFSRTCKKSLSCVKRKCSAVGAL
ncbi:MAG: leucine-rich repeat domain-containing protein, partial [Clostridia bacterium]|nr:leucine-rich repeat domain-containing protein [Clostridia bacterium]